MKIGMLFVVAFMAIFAVASVLADQPVPAPSLTACQVACSPGPGYVRLIKAQTPTGSAMVCLCHERVDEAALEPADQNAASQSAVAQKTSDGKRVSK